MAIRSYDFLSGVQTPVLPTASDPSAASDFVNKGYADLTYTPMSSFATKCADYNAIKAISASSRADGQIRFVTGTHEIWEFRSASTDADNGVSVLQPTSGTGRWHIIETGGGGGGGSSIEGGLESITELSKIRRGYVASSIKDAISEPFIEAATNRITLSNTQVNTSQCNATLTSTNLSGTVENEIYLEEAKAGTSIEFSTRFNSDTIFDVSTGNSTTESVLTSTTDRHLEVKNATNVPGWFVLLKRSSASLPWKQADLGTRVEVSAATGATNITITHTALSGTLPAATSTAKYVWIAESVKTEVAIAGGSYTEITPSQIKVLDRGLSYPSYVHSHWRMDGTANEINQKQTSGYDLTQIGTVPSVAGILGNARGQFSASNYFRWYAGGSSATVFDGTTYFFSAWIKTSATATDMMIVQKGNHSSVGWDLAVYSATNKLRMFINNSGYTSSGATVTSGNWTHVLVTMLATSGANNLRFYVNGALDYSNTGFAMSPGVQDFAIGYDISSGASPFLGYIDDVVYANTVPSSQAEMDALAAAIYNSGRGASFGSITGFYLKGSLDAQTGALGAQFQSKETIRREVSTVNPSLEAVNVMFKD